MDDDGPGIPVELREDVFKPFFRLDASRNTTTGGVGLVKQQRAGGVGGAVVEGFASRVRGIEFARDAEHALDSLGRHYRARHADRAEECRARQLIEGEHGGALEPQLVLESGGRVPEAVRGAQRGRPDVRLRRSGERQRARRPTIDEEPDRRRIHLLLVEQLRGSGVGELVRALVDRDVHPAEAESLQDLRIALERATRGELTHGAGRRRVGVGDSTNACAIRDNALVRRDQSGFHSTLPRRVVWKGAARGRVRRSVRRRSSVAGMT